MSIQHCFGLLSTDLLKKKRKHMEFLKFEINYILNMGCLLRQFFTFPFSFLFFK